MPATAANTRTLGVREASAARFRPRAPLDQPAGNPAITQAVARARSGDREAVRVLYARYEDSVYGYVLSMIRDQREAEHVTSQVFLTLMSVVHEHEPRLAPFTSWLLRVARDVAVDHLRQQHSVPCEAAHEPRPHADDSAHERPWKGAQAVEVGSDEEANVTVLRHLVGLTPGEQSELTDSDRAPAARAAAS